MRVLANSNLTLVVICCAALFAVVAFEQYMSYRLENHEGPLRQWLMGAQRPGKLTRTLAAYPYWYKVLGSVVDVKVEVYGNTSLYYPVFSYAFLGAPYMNTTKKGYEANKYPVGTRTMLLVPEQNPQDYTVLHDMHKYSWSMFIFTCIIIACILIYRFLL